MVKFESIILFVSKFASLVLKSGWPSVMSNQTVSVGLGVAPSAQLPGLDQLWSPAAPVQLLVAAGAEMAAARKKDRAVNKIERWWFFIKCRTNRQVPPPVF